MSLGARAASGHASGVLVAGLAGPMPEAGESELLRELRPAGVILFARNVEDERQVRRLTSRIRELLDEPLILIDQEGGRVDRLRALDGRSPSLREAAAGGPEVLRGESSRTARRLKGLGINVNCVPVLDLDEGQDNGIGDRAAGVEPARVAECGRIIVRAHEAEGIATTLKHFPGLGRTDRDTHLARPAVLAGREELLEREVVPFRLLLDEAPAVMVSHAAFPGLGAGDEPASCSREIVERLLRRDLGFLGACVTDDLEMGAVAAWPPAERAVRALAAGQDLLLFCSDLAQLREAHAGIVAAIERGELLPERLAEASIRVSRLRRAYGCA